MSKLERLAEARAALDGAGAVCAAEDLKPTRASASAAIDKVRWAYGPQQARPVVDALLRLWKVAT